MNTILIGSTRTAKALCNAGFVIVNIKPHKRDSKRTAFIFNNTPEIQEFILLNNLEV
jgi:hypothetical protein